MIKKILLPMAAFLWIALQPAYAQYVMVVPQKPGGGTSVWAHIVAEQLEPFLNESIHIRHFPGARDIPGFNEWHNEIRKNPKTIMVSHGGNGVSFLQENVDYDYREYESIGLMNLNIIAAKRTNIENNEKIRFASGSGMVPEAMAMTMLLCGPQEDVDEYISCFNDNVIWVKGMSGGERRLAFRRGELNGTRENPAAFLKHVTPLINEGDAEVWFHHGLLDADTKKHIDDSNYPNMQFEILFENKWGTYPSGDFYDAYKLVKSFRDGLQKAMWMDPESQYIEDVRIAVKKMSEHDETREAFKKLIGDYDWLVGDNGNHLRDTLLTFITRAALETLVHFNKEALGLSSIFKPELTQ